ncbi:hypothetical protein H4W80_005643 [Nonomuraea angiospora]|uniref:Uncharacterized protein n=1 Tax=Nonomuraea angiospora TaxID=46172 RepID=A0ABR9M454_9ACTN|nr:hypothetical protein [Nonomuraea angiospora]
MSTAYFTTESDLVLLGSDIKTRDVVAGATAP